MASVSGMALLPPLNGPSRMVVGRCICGDNPYSERPRRLCGIHDRVDSGGVPLIRTDDLYETRTDSWIAWDLWVRSVADELDVPCTCPLSDCDPYDFKQDRGCDYCFEVGPCSQAAT